MSEKPFKINVPESEIALLRQKLELTRLPDELDEVGWQYGVPLADVKRLVQRWKTGFDWRKSEEELNKLPHFTRDIDIEKFGVLNVHYIHKKSVVAGAIPLLFIHGWPGSFLEVLKILPLLVSSSPDHPSFHVVTFSLPGFGFSEAPKKPGFAIPQYAEVGHKLMLALGYNEYGTALDPFTHALTKYRYQVVQGGDWGSRISYQQNTTYAHKHVKAWHTNAPLTQGPPKLLSHPRLYLTHLITPYTEREKAGFARMEWFNRVGGGYFAEQSTQPQTIGYSLADSPVGLLAWIYEKLVQWTDEYPWTDDEVLQWISIYWFSRPGPAASLRIYYEATKNMDMKELPPTTVPMGISLFPQELMQVPKVWARALGNIVFEAEHDSGGHFAAHEKPAELVGDLRKMFGKGGPAFGVVPGKNGYASL